MTASFVPSGDQDGNVSRPPSWVSWVREEPLSDLDILKE